MKRSIRSSLLLSYAVTLFLVLGLLGGSLYRQRDAAMHGALETELLAHAHALAGALEWDEHDGFELDLDDSYLGRFRLTGEDVPAFEIRDGQGAMLFTPATGLDPAPPAPTRRGPMRAVRVAGTNGASVWVRQSLAGIQSELRGYGRELLLLCGGGFLLALLGGWFLVNRMLAPILRISETAAAISPANPETRIDVSRMEAELGSLSVTLNGAFDRLQAAVDRQVRFTADASHDLRTPLAVLKANLEWALRAERSPEEYGETLTACLRATDRMNHMVGDLLTLARSDAEGPPTQKAPLDLKNLAEETARFVGPLAQASGLVLDVVGDPAPALGDPRQMGEAVTAVVTNALQHTPEGGRVWIRTASESTHALLEVRDTGPGIPEADLPHVFERFYRADATRREAGGLGLAIALRIVEAHGGTLEAANHPDGGAAFTIRLTTRALS